MSLDQNQSRRHQVVEDNIQHRDKIGRIIEVDDCVAVSHNNSLIIGRVAKINPKTVKVFPVDKIKSSWKKHTGYNKYSDDCVVLDGPDITMYLLKKP